MHINIKYLRLVVFKLKIIFNNLPFLSYHFCIPFSFQNEIRQSNLLFSAFLGGGGRIVLLETTNITVRND